MFRSQANEHFIDEGRVWCPVRRHDVDFDLCAGCTWTVSIDLESKTPVVRCKPESIPVWLIRR